MQNNKSKENSWRDELMDFIDDGFEREVLKIAIKEPNPERILLSVKEMVREKLHEDKKSDD